ncbi:aconitate hydratase [Lysinibacillus sp. NPDC094177]|uniref:aconitate hydratase n=1 Tax=Lysinibacillus sp. NPDC094177 TaxID=3390580 RepID=UPI003D02DD95
MIKFEQQRLLHKFVILDLAIQSLQRDFSVIENLKMCNVYMTMIEKLLKAITSEHYNIKRDLAKDKIKIVKWEKIDQYFSELTVTTPGEDQVLRYANQALKTQVEELLLSHINEGTD